MPVYVQARHLHPGDLAYLEPRKPALRVVSLRSTDDACAGEKIEIRTERGPVTREAEQLVAIVA